MWDYSFYDSVPSYKELYDTSITMVRIGNGVTVIDDCFYDCYKLKDIYYYGTEEEWNKIQINDSNGNCKISDMTIHFNYGGGTITDDDAITDDDSPSVDDCSCSCHKSGFMSFIYKILRFFWKLFKINSVCSCGVAHY